MIGSSLGNHMMQAAGAAGLTPLQQLIAASAATYYLPEDDPTRYLWADAGRTTKPVNSGTIYHWDDASPNGRHATATDAARRPTYLADYNGRPAVRFIGNGFIDPANDLMLAPGLTVIAEMACRVRFANATAVSFGSMFGNRLGTPSLDRWHVFEAGATRHHGNPFPRAVERNGVSAASPFDIPPLDEWFVYQCRTANPGNTRPEGACLGQLEETYALNYATDFQAAFAADLSADDRALIESLLAV